jgi:hypothetical protein
VLEQHRADFAERALRLAADEARYRVTESHARVSPVRASLTQRERVIPSARFQTLLSDEDDFGRARAGEGLAQLLERRDVSVRLELQLKASSSRSANGAMLALKRSPASVTIS